MRDSLLAMDEYEYVTDILSAVKYGIEGKDQDHLDKIIEKLGQQPLREAVIEKTLFKCSVCGMEASEIFKTCPSCGVASSKIKIAVVAAQN